jgi:glycosyltransferase involved in cell wall biosynthesis
MPTPAVSVVMPIYNAAPWLPAALGSVLGQTLADFELLAVDDGSTDESVDILRRASDPRVRVLTGPHRGVVAAMRTALAEARAPVVARADADDVSLPDRLERQVQYLDRHPEIAIAGAAAWRQGRRLVSPPDTARIRWTALYRNPFANPTVVFRRKAALAVGGYPEDHVHVDDYPFVSRLIDRFPAANLPAVLVRMTVHPASLSVVHSAAAIAESDRVRRANLRRLVGDEPTVAALFFLLAGGPRPGGLRAGNVAPLLERLRAAFVARYGPPAGPPRDFDRWLGRQLFERALLHGPQAPDVALAMCRAAAGLAPVLWVDPRTVRSLLRRLVLARFSRR